MVTIAGHRPIFVNGSDVDDTTATALLDHLPRGQLRPKKRALEINGHDFFVLLLGGIEHGRARFYAGVVDHDIHAAKFLHGGVNEALQLVHLADVRQDADNAVAEGMDLFFQGFSGFGVGDVIDDDVCALAREFEGDGQADAAIATGHDGDFIF
jgi:hypothetical protein